MENISRDTIEDAARGDLAAFEAIYRECSGYVFNVAWRIVNNRADAEEVVQEVFLVIHRKLKHYRFESAFKTWVYRVAANSAVDYVRKSARTRPTDEYRAMVQAAPPAGPSGQPADERRIIETTRRVFERLPADQKTCMVLRHIEGLSYKEIADTLDININTVRTRLRRARETLLALRHEVLHHEL